MISGNPDERLAFVIDTEAHLDGIRTTRAEMAGVGADADALGGRLASMSAKSKASFDAMTAAEKQAFLGFVGVKAGADQASEAVSRNTTQLIAHNRALTDRQMENRRATLAMMGLRKADIDAATAVDTHAAAAKKDTDAVTTQTAAIERSAVALARQRQAAEAAAQASIPRSPAAYAAAANPMLGPALPPGGLQAVAETGRVVARTNAAIAASFDPIPGKARTAANAMSTLSFQAAGLTAGGQSSVIAMGSLVTSLAHLSTSARIAASASGIGAIVVIAATLIPLLSRLAGESERVSGTFRKAFGAGDNADLFLQTARSRRAAAQTAYENAPALSMGGDFIKDRGERANRKKALDEAVADEQAAIEAVIAARRAARRRAEEEAIQEAKDRKRDRERTNDMYFATTNERIQAEMRGSGNLEGADIEAAEVERVNREIEINALKISDAEKADLRARNVEASEARITEIQNRYADERIRKYDEEARKQEDLDKRKAAKRLSIARENVHALVMAEGSILQTMKRLALEPIVNRLEGIAAQQAVESLASAAALDFRGAAMHAAAAAAAIVAARTVAGWAGGGTKGGGGAGAGSGGGSGPGSFEPRQSTAGQDVAVFNLYTQNPYGPELIQQVKWELGRADVLKRPGAQIPPTTGFRAA